ncbi:MAG: hypothetical protein GY841_16230 [FCB group bacterium]|nr:hypothetical protein [FCB group bacterium]
MVNKERLIGRIIKYADNHNLCIDFYPGCAEAGYDDNPVLAADWNPTNMERIGHLIERMETVSLEWSNEWTGCSNCYKAVRIVPDSYGWEASYVWASDCETVCRECWEDSIYDIIEFYKNDTSKVLPSDMYPLLESEGFVCYSPDEYCERFKTGLHPGDNDMPEDIAKDIEKNLPDYDYLFKIDSAEQFTLNWSVLIRRKEEV